MTKSELKYFEAKFSTIRFILFIITILAGFTAVWF